MIWWTVFLTLFIGTLFSGVFGYFNTGSPFHIVDSGGGSTIFPSNLHLTFTSLDDTESLSLYLRKSSFNVNAPLFIVCGTGKSICRAKNQLENVAYYQDETKGATLSVFKDINPNNQTHHIWSGHIMLNDTQYDIQRTTNSSSSRVQYTLIHTPDLTGTNDYTFISNTEEIQNSNPHRKTYKKRRRKRRGGNVLGVELLVIIDNVIFQQWYKSSKATRDILKFADAENKLRSYFAHVVNGMDLRYRAIRDSRFQIHITLAAYIMGEGDVPLPFFANAANKASIDADQTLSRFRDWIQETDGLPAFDHAMLFTGHDIYTVKGGVRTDSVTGLAYMGLICTRSSVSIVEYHGGFSSARIATHELGHSLGAEHDGDNNHCKASNQYIMTSKDQPTSDPGIRRNPWQFSTCSLDAFYKMVTRLRSSTNRHCLFDSATHFNQAQWDQYTNQHPGQLFNIDDICRQYFGPSSYMCRDLMKSQEEICTTLWCSRPNTNQCRQHVPPRGTSCGNFKWCLDGACTWNKNAPARTGNCVHGNHPSIVHEGRTCKQMVKAEPYYCYQDFISKRCCEECNKYYVPVLGCEYGNRQKNCPENWCTYQGEKRSQILKQCCGTCRVGTPIRSTTFSPIPSVTSYPPSRGCTDLAVNCADLVNRFPTNCYLTSFEQDCCVSCRSIKSRNPDCNYGDRDPHGCRGATVSQCRVSNVAKYNCCNTCSVLEGTIVVVGDGSTLLAYVPLIGASIALQLKLFGYMRHLSYE